MGAGARIGCLHHRNALAASDTVARLHERSVDFEWTDVQLLSDDPRKGSGELKEDELLFFRMKKIMGRPAQRLDLVSAYLVPGERGTAALAAIAKDGAKVRVLTNALEATDVVLVHAGYAKRRRTLLEAGIELFELKRIAGDAADKDEARFRSPSGSSAASLHTKTIAVDSRFLFVGSFNFDLRSLRLNTEMGFVIHSEQLANRLHEAFRERIPLASYRPTLVDESLVWRDKDRVLDHEPGASRARRAMLIIVSWLPVEWLL
jgi:putative cardiolipin synthase